MLRTLVFLFLSVCSVPASPQDAEDTGVTITYLNQINETPSMSAGEKLDRILSHTDKIEASKDRLVYLHGLTLQAELLISMEEFDRALSIINSALPEAELSKFDYIVLALKLARLSAMGAAGSFAEKSQYEKELLEYVAKTEDVESKINIYLTVGHSQYLDSASISALENLTRAYELSVNFGNEDLHATVLNGIAGIYAEIGDTDLAFRYYSEALAQEQSNGDKYEQSVILYNIASTLLDLGKYQQARENLQASLLLSKEVSDSAGVAWSSELLASIYAKMGDHQQAMTLYQQALDFFQSNDNWRMQYQCLAGITASLVELGDAENARKVLNELKDLDQHLDVLDFDVELMDLEARVEVLSGDFEAAYKAKKQHTILLHQFYEQQRNDSLQLLKVRFESDKQQAEMEQLQRENQIKQLRIDKHEKIQQYGMAVSLLSVVILVLILLGMYRQKQLKRSYQKMALTDPLTNAPNRRSVLTNADNLLSSPLNRSQSLSFCLLDIDHFKRINDSFGHQVGDRVLIAVAECCKQVLRSQDSFGRYGGEEWLLVLPDCQTEEVVKVMERLHQRINEVVIEGLPQDYSIGFSVGVCTQTGGPERSLNGMIQTADQHLYRAKSAGRNCIAMEQGRAFLPAV